MRDSYLGPRVRVVCDLGPSLVLLTCIINYLCVGPCMGACIINFLCVGPWQTEYAKRSGYEVTAGGTNSVFYVKDTKSPDGKEFEVDITRGLTTVKCCAYVTKHLQPCQHMIPVFYQRNMMSTARATRATIATFWPRWALAENYQQMYAGKNVLRPQLYSGPFEGPEEDRLLAPIQTSKPRGRPKKKRYKWKPKTVKQVAEWLPVVYNEEYSAVCAFI